MNGAILPRTSQPAVGDFVDVYRKLAEQGHEIVSVHISDKLSGTMNSARLASADVSEAQVSIVDSGTSSLALGLVVKVAAEAAKAGKSHEEVTAIAQDAFEKTTVFFVLDTLEYLQKGGRIGKAAALFGGMLSIKPILTVVDGEIHPYEKVRTRAKAVAKITEIAHKNGPYAEVAIIHDAGGDEVEMLLKQLEPLSDRSVINGKIGAVIGVYSGPGVIGVALRKA